ncbi:MAG TPA: polyamine aminopropyltransferase [Burkholderiales bacterium]|nr:polyamine aminopropyltransferase [Burkholderiales bacterium]
MGMLGSWRIRKPAEDAETVYISEKFGVRALHIGSDTVQSAMRIAAPNDLELSYTRSMMGFLLFHEKPQSVLMIGLGGGSVAKFLYYRMPWTMIRVIEISARVLTVARRYFGVPVDDERFEVILGDGAEFINRPQVCADLVMVDGFDGESLVEALSSVAFYRDCHDRLNTRGMLVVNLWGGDREFNETLKRIEAAFPAGTLCLPAEKPGNVIVFGFRSTPGRLAWAALEQRALALEPHYGLGFLRFIEGLRRMNRHDEKHLLI